MNCSPIALRFVSGSVTPASAVEEALAGVDDDEVDAGRLDEVLLDLLGLALAQQPVVDEDAGQLVADRLLHQGRCDGGVDAAGERAEDAVLADLLADRRRRGRRRRWPRSSPARCRRPSRGSSRGPAGPARSAAPRGATARRRGGARRPRRRRPGCQRRGGDARSPSGASVTESPCDIHTTCSSAGRRRASTRRAMTDASVLPYSRAPVRSTVPPSARDIAWKP